MEGWKYYNEFWEEGEGFAGFEIRENAGSGLHPYSKLYVKLQECAEEWFRQQWEKKKKDEARMKADAEERRQENVTDDTLWFDTWERDNFGDN